MTIRIWDIETCPVVGEALTGHTAGMQSVVYYPNDIVSGSTECTIRIWDAETGAAVGESLRGRPHGLGVAICLLSRWVAHCLWTLGQDHSCV